MSTKKPGLILFASTYLFLMTVLAILPVLPVLVFSPSPIPFPQLIIILVVSLGMASLCIASGIGLLKRLKWARLSSIIIFALIFLSQLTMSRSLDNKNVSEAFRTGQTFGRFLTLGLTSLGLYAMTLDKSVKAYFNRDAV